MAGRGWSKTTFSQDQLQAMGVVGMDMPTVILEPPPTYPTLSSKPQPFEESEAIAYAFKKNLEISNEKHKSQFRQKNIVKYQYMIRDACNYEYRDIKDDFAWANLPEELGPGRVKRSKKVRKNKKQIQDRDIVERLTDLEKKEEQLDSTIDVERKRRNSEELGEDEDEAEEENQAHTDEEYDDDNDYGNSYFDNGEAYDDNADEPLDDGPIY